jgi:predicted ester cyclase
MSREEIERLDDEGMSAWDQHDPQAWAEQFADEFVLTDWLMPDPITTKEGVRGYMEAWLGAFPDMRVKQVDRVANEDAVAGVVEFTGTNTGSMVMGGNEIPPTNKSVVGHGTYLARVKNGKVVRFDSHPDAAGIMMQLGLVPPM